jgi:hypothetical protein
VATLRLQTRLEVTADRLRGCTPWAARLLWLCSFEQCVTIDRRARSVTVETRRLWVRRSRRSIPFEAVARIVYRAQAIPGLSPSRLLLWLLWWGDPGEADSAFFFVSLALRDTLEELPLFTVWESQPRPTDWLDRLAGGPEPDPRLLGDESAGSIVDLLHRYLGVPVASH